MNTHIGLLDWSIFIVYVAVVLGIGIWFSRFQDSTEDYFLGGRKMNWFAVGASLFATAFSSISFVMLPREGAYADYHLFTTILFIPLVITPILWYLFVPLFLRLKITSVYEYLGIRFNNRLRKLGAILFGAYAIGWMGSMLYAVGIIVQATLGLSHVQFLWVLVGIGIFATFYTALGGYEAVVWTDLLQSVTLGVGMLIVLYIIVDMVSGDIFTLIETGREHDKFQMLNMQFELTERSSFWAAAGFALFMYLPGYTASQITVQRYLSMKDLKQARQSLLINATIAPVISLIFFLVGTALFVFYTQQGGFPEIPSQDQLLPYFLATELPIAGLTGLLLAGLFAAGMSTIDSGINSMTAVIVKDFIPDRGKELNVNFSRKITLILGVVIVFTSLLVPLIGEHVIEMIAKIAGTFLGLLLGIYLLGMFTRCANTNGALIGLMAGGLSLTWVWTQTTIPHWYYGLFTIGGTFVIGWLASYFFTSPSDAQLTGYFLQKNDQ
ncbi:MAG: sodium/solute symporter [Balneolales bacterium]